MARTYKNINIGDEEFDAAGNKYTREAYPPYKQGVLDLIPMGSSGSIAAGASGYTASLWDCSDYALRSFYLTITGDGTVSVYLQGSEDGVTFFEVVAALAADLTVASGNSGKVIVTAPADSFLVYARLRFAVTGGTGTTIVTKAGGRP